MLTGGDDGTVFLNYLGQPYLRMQLTALVRGYLIDSKVGKMGGCHLFRHTVATLMLQNGADVRVIQETLGHAKLTTTELYTRVSINLLKQVFAATHPAADEGRTARDADAASRDSWAPNWERSSSSSETHGGRAFLPARIVYVQKWATKKETSQSSF